MTFLTQDLRSHYGETMLKRFERELRIPAAFTFAGLILIASVGFLNLWSADTREARECILEAAKQNSNCKFFYKEQRNLNLRNSNYSQAFFKSSKLTNVDFSGSDFSKARFFRTSVSGSNFKESIFDGATFNSAKFRGNNLSNLDFSKAIFVRFPPKKETLNKYAVDFTGSNLMRSNFRKQDLLDVKFEESDLSFCDFSDSTIDINSLFWANVEGVSFEGVKFVEGYALHFGNFDESTPLPIGESVPVRGVPLKLPKGYYLKKSESYNEIVRLQ